MRTRLAFPVLIILQFQVITAQNVSLEDFKIGMFGVKANKAVYMFPNPL